MTHQAGLGVVGPFEELSQHLAVLGQELVYLVQHHDDHWRNYFPPLLEFELRAKRLVDIVRDLPTPCDSSPESIAHFVGVRERSTGEGMEVWGLNFTLARNGKSVTHGK